MDLLRDGQVVSPLLYGEEPHFTWHVILSCS